MELVHSYQVGLNELCTERIDYFIAASGYQRRSTFLAEQVRIGDAKKILLTPADGQNPELQQKNEEVFAKLGFLSLNTLQNERLEIEKILHQICNETHCKDLNILVDYSCMTKLSYASIIDFLIRNDLPNERINLFFSYTPKQINTLPAKIKVKSLQPIVEFNQKVNQKPTSLIIGLNSNIEPVKEVIERISPSRIFLFVPRFQHDECYHSNISILNGELIERVPSENVFKYPANQPDQIISMLTSVCLDQRLDSNVILIPHGPKTFALSSILLTFRYPDIRLLEIDQSEKKVQDEGFPANDPIIVKSVFSQEEDY
ncbi:MAG: hypothetical protein HC906_11345 [Bacteroidales bacterium]|nr:hypothetical protein [Bacteroidales bacterium]